MKHIYTSLDIGSDSIKVVVCELCKNKLNLLGASSVKSSGIKRGVISDPRAAIMSIKKAISEVEAMLGISINKVLVNVPSYFAEYKTFKEEYKHDGTIVDGEVMKKITQQIISNNTTRGYEIAAIQTTDYLIDDSSYREIRGINAKSIVARGVVTLIPKENLYSVVALLENNGINVIDCCISPIADYYAYKTKQYDGKNGVLVDIGAETTTISIVTKGIIAKSSIIQLGGKSLDNDIAYIYKIDNKLAVELKEKFALAHSIGAKSDEVRTVKNIINDEVEINQYKVSEICMARLEEIMNSIKNEISSLTNIENNYIIITGGTSNMRGLGKLVGETLGTKANIESIKLLGVRNNKFATSIGTIIYFISKLKSKGQEYTMISDGEVADIIASARGKNIKDESVLDKVFNYFFSE